MRFLTALKAPVITLGIAVGALQGNDVAHAIAPTISGAPAWGDGTRCVRLGSSRVSALAYGFVSPSTDLLSGVHLRLGPIRHAGEEPARFVVTVHPDAEGEPATEVLATSDAMLTGDDPWVWVPVPATTLQIQEKYHVVVQVPEDSQASTRVCFLAHQHEQRPATQPWVVQRLDRRGWGAFDAARRWYEPVFLLELGDRLWGQPYYGVQVEPLFAGRDVSMTFVAGRASELGDVQVRLEGRRRSVPAEFQLRGETDQLLATGSLTPRAARNLWSFALQASLDAPVILEQDRRYHFVLLAPEATGPERGLLHRTPVTDFSGAVEAGSRAGDTNMAARAKVARRMMSVDFDSVPTTCGNGIVDGAEYCDGNADAACPGLCGSDCRCEVAGPETNVAGKATVVASSEQRPWHRAQNVVDGIIGGTADQASSEWVSRDDGVGAWVRLWWKKPVRVDRVVLHDRPDTRNNLQSAILRFDDDSEIAIDTLPPDGRGSPIVFAPRLISALTLVATSFAGAYPGLAEIEVLAAAEDPAAMVTPTLTPAASRTSTPVLTATRTPTRTAAATPASATPRSTATLTETPTRTATVTPSPAATATPGPGASPEANSRLYTECGLPLYKSPCPTIAHTTWMAQNCRWIQISGGSCSATGNPGRTEAVVAAEINAVNSTPIINSYTTVVGVTDDPYPFGDFSACPDEASSALMGYPGCLWWHRSQRSGAAGRFIRILKNGESVPAEPLSSQVCTNPGWVDGNCDTSPTTNCQMPTRCYNKHAWLADWGNPGTQTDMIERLANGRSQRTYLEGVFYDVVSDVLSSQTVPRDTTPFLIKTCSNTRTCVGGPDHGTTCSVDGDCDYATCRQTTRCRQNSDCGAGTCAFRTLDTLWRKASTIIGLNAVTAAQRAAGQKVLINWFNDTSTSPDIASGSVPVIGDIQGDFFMDEFCTTFHSTRTQLQTKIRAFWYMNFTGRETNCFLIDGTPAQNPSGTADTANKGWFPLYLLTKLGMSSMGRFNSQGAAPTFVGGRYKVKIQNWLEADLGAPTSEPTCVSCASLGNPSGCQDTTSTKVCSVYVRTFAKGRVYLNVSGEGNPNGTWPPPASTIQLTAQLSTAITGCSGTGASAKCRNLMNCTTASCPDVTGTYILPPRRGVVFCDVSAGAKCDPLPF